MLIHIGYHKTATTWLQERYFAHHPEVLMVGDMTLIWEHVAGPHALDFDATAARRFFEPQLEEAARQGKVPVVSSERLSGNPHSGGYDSKEIANRLFQVFPEGRVLVVVRNQVAMIESMYKQYVRMGGVSPLPEYLDPPRDRKLPLFSLDHLRYHRLVAWYGSLFGLERVKVLPYEWFAGDASAFLREVARFAGIDESFECSVDERVYPGLADLSVALRRRVNRWRGGSSFNPVRIGYPGLTGRLLNLADRIGASSLGRLRAGRYRNYVEARVGDYYVESNRELARMTGLELEGYGYRI